MDRLIKLAAVHLLIVWSYLHYGTDAYPGWISSCSAWHVGDKGYMGVSNLTDGSGGDCVINADDVPSSGFAFASSYSITVSSSSPSLYKLYSSDGQCLGDAVSVASLATSWVFSWRAPNSGSSSITFHALCSVGYTSLAVATSGPKTPAAGANTITTTATVTVTNTGSIAAPKVFRTTDIPLGSTDLTLSFKPDGDDSIEFEMTVAAKTWIGFGLAKGDIASMNGGGKGAETVTCSNGRLQRYWVTSYDLLPPAADVPGSSCTQANGRTTLRYKRPIATSTWDRIPVTPGRVQTFIFARGADGETRQAEHAADEQFRGGLRIDVASGRIVEPEKRAGEAVLFMHLGLMIISWGCMLPLGAVVARFFKFTQWFWWHRILQMTGWTLQLLGFVMAVIYCQEYSFHFNSFHTWLGLFIVVFGTMHPVNAYFRPGKPPEGEEKSTKRKAWEVLHKWGGWLILLLGLWEVLSGCMLIGQKGYDQLTLIIAYTLAIVCVLTPIFALIYSCVKRQKVGDEDEAEPSVDPSSVDPSIVGKSE